MAVRINVMLPESTVRVIDRLTRPGERSRFIDRAVRHYVSTASQRVIEERLKQAAIRDRDLDLSVVDEWLPADLAEWQRLDTQENHSRGTGPKKGRSTSRHSSRR
jgi:hypothetical protein